ncbi:hypothetical protein CCR75_001201 [Bremia lactucae]|uniref:K Homology domain-containing protein n=1 Tax=Bremia lactucae TaxID=4779 RepID=A0A976IFU4_BRELC|nr:hypothetical protein CCR75_001201 [Bremia lactucae]
MSLHDQTKRLAIPAHVPVGAVIGKKGSYCKALREDFSVRCSVNDNDREITLKGSSTGLKSAEDRLTSLFATFTIKNPKQDRVFHVVVRDGRTRWWSFKTDMETTSDMEVAEYPYRLQQSGLAVNTVNKNSSWVQEFRDDEIADVMRYLKQEPSASPLKIKIAFGKLCFKLLSIRCKEASIAWPDLQKLSSLLDFKTRWSNFCNRLCLPIASLLDDLEDWMEQDEESKIMSVHIAGKKSASYDLKFYLIKGEWKLHRSYKGPHVRGTYDVILSNEVSFRVRAKIREKLSESESADIRRYIDISIPDGGDCFSTEVMLSRNAPSGMHIKSFNVRSKAHVEANGLRYTISYLNQRRDEFRLECRLAAEEKNKLRIDDNEAHVLLQKVLQMLTY